jgi:hypothetical protein
MIKYYWLLFRTLIFHKYGMQIEPSSKDCDHKPIWHEKDIDLPIAKSMA